MPETDERFRNMPRYDSYRKSYRGEREFIKSKLDSVTVHDTPHCKLVGDVEQAKLNEPGGQNIERQTSCKQAKHEKAIFWPTPGL